ncbi:hypothetical protein EDD11_010105 [Mortierella claussenii]|nr:hypothetical protein EDD11_010105 [Mortierella claussenii]
MPPKTASPVKAKTLSAFFTKELPASSPSSNSDSLAAASAEPAKSPSKPAPKKRASKAKAKDTSKNQQPTSTDADTSEVKEVSVKASPSKTKRNRTECAVVVPLLQRSHESQSSSNSTDQPIAFKDTTPSPFLVQAKVTPMSPSKQGVQASVVLNGAATSSPNGLSKLNKIDSASMFKVRNGKAYITENKLKFSAHPAAVADLCRFHEYREKLQDVEDLSQYSGVLMVSDHAEITSIPSEHHGLVAKLVEECDLVLSEAATHILTTLCPPGFEAFTDFAASFSAQDGDGKMDVDGDIDVENLGEKQSVKRTSTTVSTAAIMEAIQAVARRVNYGIPVSSLPGQVPVTPANLSVYRWEVHDIDHYFPGDMRAVVIKRRAKRVEASAALTAWFLGLEAKQQEELCPIPVTPIQVPGADLSIMQSLNSQGMDVDGGHLQPSNIATDASGTTLPGVVLVEGQPTIAAAVDPAVVEAKLKEAETKKKEAEAKEERRLEKERKMAEKQLEKDLKEAERLQKEEAKKRKAEEERMKKEQTSMRFVGFFKPTPTLKKDGLEPCVKNDEAAPSLSELFHPFHIKKYTTLAPINRFVKSASTEIMDTDLRINLKRDTHKDSGSDMDVDLDQDVPLTLDKRQARETVASLFSGRSRAQDTTSQQRKKRLPEHYKTMSVSEAVRSGLLLQDEGDDTSYMLTWKDIPSLRMRLLQFAENYRPAYFGTWSRRSKIATGRGFLKKDTEQIDYDFDSEAEWEEDEEGEECKSEDDEEDAEDVGSEQDEEDDWLVPEGYLSEDEGLDAGEEGGSEMNTQRKPKEVRRTTGSLGTGVETVLGECSTHPALEAYHIEFLGDYGIGMDLYHATEQLVLKRRVMVDSGAQQPLDISLGTRVEVSGNLGYVRYAGQTSFAPGRWVGVELDQPKGKNAGVVEGKRYFECRDKHGVFVRASQARVVVDAAGGSPAQTETNGRSSRPTSIVGRSGLAAGSRLSVSGRSATTKVPAASAAPTTASASRLSRPPTRRPTGTDSTLESPASSRRVRAPVQAPRDDNVRMTDQTHFNTPPTSSTQHQQLQRDDTSLEEDEARLLAQEQAIQEELEEEEALAQRQLQQDQQGFAPPPAPGPSASVPSQPDVAATGATAQKSEMNVPLKDYEELRIKLRILEAKRTEDRERIREADKAKEESEQFLNIRTKLQAKLTEMQQELRDSKRVLKEAVAEKEAFETKYNDVVDSMEVTLLDKEMAEERAENLQHEVNMLKERVEEMHVDLNVFQQEESNLSNPAVNQIQLERQNERLKEALLRLRDMTSEQEAEMTRKLKNLEKEASLVQEVQIQNDKLRESLELAENQIEELKQRLDDAIGAEDMIEQLSEKNITLGEKIEEMQSAIDDLEALKELNDELEENHSETEKQLQAEINVKDSQIREQQRRIETLEENLGDYENTILQFRELVAHLQSDLEQLRQKEESKNSGLGSQSQAMLSLNLQLQSTAMKAQAKAIDLELRKLDALQANDNLMLVQPYLPDGFFGTENDSIQCLLLFKRLSFKSELMSKHLEQQYGISDKIARGAVSSEIVPVCEVRQKLTLFGDMAKRFVSYIEGCSVEVFAKMGQVYHDLVGTERRLNTWVELLRKEELKESDCAMELQRAIAQLDHLVETYLANTKLDLVERYHGAIHVLDLNLDRIFINLADVGAMFKSNEDGIRLVDSDDIQYQLVQTVASMGSQARSGKATTRKILRKLDELASQASVVKPECFTQYKNACTASTKLGEFTHEVRRRISQYVQARREGGKTDSIHQTIYNVTDTHLGISETGMWDGCRKLLNGLLQDITALGENVLDPEVAVKVAKPDKVWIKRAKDMKAKVVVNFDAEQKAQSLQDQVFKLVKETKLKDQVLQESNLKIELLGKQMETFKKQAEQISILDRDVDKAKKQERDYDEAISALQADMAALEEQNAQLRRLVKKSESRSITAPMKRPSHHGQHGHSGSMHDQDLSGSMVLDGSDTGFNKELLIQVESLKSALRFLRSENASLRTRAAMLDLGLTADVSALAGPLSRKFETDEASLQSDVDRPEAQKRLLAADSELRAVALETKRLLKDARVVCASPKVVDLTKHTTFKFPVSSAASAEESTSTHANNRRAWQTQQTRPEWQYHTQQAALHTIQQRSSELKERLSKVSRVGVHPTPTKLKKLTLTDAPIGRVRMPLGVSGLVGTPEASQARTRSDLAVFLRSSAEFEAMHQLFVR